MLDSSVIKSIIVTEKAYKASCSPDYKVYVFKVANDATKPVIKKTVEGAFDVKVRAVNTVTNPAKIKYRKGIKGKKASYKKAYVTLDKNFEIDISESA